MEMSVWTQLYVGEDPVGGPEQVDGSFQTISQFKRAVKQLWAHDLKHVDAPRLSVHSSGNERNEKNALEVDLELSGYVTSKNMPLVVVAPLPPSEGVIVFIMFLAV